MATREDDLAEAVLGLATVAALVVDSYERQPPEGTSLTEDLRRRFRQAAVTWSDEHPEISPGARVIVRRVVFDSVVRDDP